MANSIIAIFPMTLIRAGGLPLHAWMPFACGIPDWSGLRKDEESAATELLRSFDAALLSLTESPIRTAVYNTRKDFFQRKKAPSVNIETMFKAEPSLFQVLENLDFWQKMKRDQQIAAHVFEEKLVANYQALQVIAREETLHRALLFASHDLLASLPTFCAKQVEDFDKRDRRTAFSLFQYLTRAVFKTSPLGRFTTVQAHSLALPDLVGSGGGLPMEELVFLNMPKSLVSPNVAILPAIYEVLLREPVFFQSLTLSLNPCLADEKPGASWLYFDGEREAFQQIEPDPVADFVVKTLLGNQRKLPYSALIEVLKSEVEATEPQLQSLIAQLIDIGMLEWQLPERGLSAGWCGGLYNYLGYLPASPVLTEAAYLLQWLRTAARTMPFQTIAEAQNLQRETLKEAKMFLEKHGGVMPPISPEQIFFEDVAKDNPVDLPPGTVEKLVGQLAECWRAQDLQTLSVFRTRIFDFAQKSISEGQSIGFLEFSRAFLEMSGELAQDTPATLFAEAPLRLKSPVQAHHQGKVGALLQIFQENGAYKAVVNALYPGGGKLFARWLALFSAEVSEQLKSWQNTDEVQTAAFPWQGWSNANFQPTFSSVSLEVPDGRVGHLPSGRAILLADLAIRKDAGGFPQLIEKQNNQPLVFNDLGLEAPITRPPVMQILWHLGVPMVSLDALLPQGFGWEKQGEIRYRRRMEFQSLILSRSAWELSPEVWGKLFAEGQTQAERIGLGIATLKAIGIPRYFFGQFRARREKPQFFDMESPISMLLLEKNLRGGAGNFLLTEMLPRPEQWLGDRVGEFVVEFQVS